MSTTSKSVKKVLQVAYEISNKRLPKYWHECSPKTYTQAQLFCCLVLKGFLELDYRGTSEMMEDFVELRNLLGLSRSPHYATLQRACQRLLKEATVKELLEETLGAHQFKKMVAL